MGIRIQDGDHVGEAKPSVDSAGGLPLPQELQEDLVRCFKERISSAGLETRKGIPRLRFSDDGWTDVKHRTGIEATWIEEDSMRDFIITDSSEHVRCDLVTSWSYETKEIVQELTEADVVMMTLYMNTADGHEHVVTDPEQLVVWTQRVQEPHMIGEERGFVYYAENLWTYHKQCKCAEERDKKETA